MISEKRFMWRISSSLGVSFSPNGGHSCDEMPEGLNSVAQAVVGKRVQFLIKKGRPVPTETFGLWNVLAKGRSWASASEL
jgi:hypothetical protein